jgi:hypothetical protein
MLPSFDYVVIGIGTGIVAWELGKKSFRGIKNFFYPLVEETISVPSAEIPSGSPYRMVIKPLALLRPEIDIIGWGWNYNRIRYVCPKCQSVQVKDYNPKICKCPNYPKYHFHFECVTCDYQAIMKTADDKEA